MPKLLLLVSFLLLNIGCHGSQIVTPQPPIPVVLPSRNRGASPLSSSGAGPREPVPVVLSRGKIDPTPLTVEESPIVELPAAVVVPDAPLEPPAPNYDEICKANCRIHPLSPLKCCTPTGECIGAAMKDHMCNGRPSTIR